jgi:hypothetical protein
MSSGGPSIVTDVIASFAYDLEAGRPDARERAESRMAELRKRFADSRKNIVAQDSIRAARQLKPLTRSLADFAGTYEEPAFGKVVITLTGDRLAYRWGALHGPVEIYDASRSQFRIEIAGSGNVMTFAPESGPVRSVEVQGVTFTRIP